MSAKDTDQVFERGGDGTLAISGSAAMFMNHDECIISTTETHTDESITAVSDNMVYGMSANGWELGFGVYMRLYMLDYDSKGGTGTLPDSVMQHIGTTTTVGSQSGLERMRISAVERRSIPLTRTTIC